MDIVSKDQLNAIFNTQNRQDFDVQALALFRLHAHNNKIYKRFLELLHVDSKEVETVAQIPCMPISFFKKHSIQLLEEEPDIIFKSSGTMQQLRSKHYINDVTIYEKSFRKCFQKFYSDPKDYHIFGLLPSYLEQGDSSLIYMVNDLIETSASQFSGFFLNEYDKLEQNLQAASADSDRSILLFGVTYALLDYAESKRAIPDDITIMETGGMKGRRKEMTKEEVHRVLRELWKCGNIHSEYGMTELLSQAYSFGKNIFATPPWMQVIMRNPNDYKEIYPHGKTGGINVIDLANIYSCPFLATDDLGKTHEDGTFEVLGRFDHSDLRGCNLLYI